MNLNNFFSNLNYNIMQELIAKMNETMAAIQADLEKVGNKAAQARVRKLTLEFEKLGKTYRKETCKK